MHGNYAAASGSEICRASAHAPFAAKIRQRKILRLEAAMKTLDELINKSEPGLDTVQ